MYDDQILLSTFSTPLQLLRILPHQGNCISFLPDLFELAFLVPEFRDMEPTLESSATDLWHSIMSQVSGEIKENISTVIRERVKVFLSDTSCLARCVLFALILNGANFLYTFFLAPCKCCMSVLHTRTKFMSGISQK